MNPMYIQRLCREQCAPRRRCVGDGARPKGLVPLTSFSRAPYNSVEVAGIRLAMNFVLLLLKGGVRAEVIQISMVTYS